MLVKVGLISLSALLSACSGVFQPTTPHSDTEMTIDQIYDRHHMINGQVHERLSLVPTNIGSDLEGYSRDVSNELSIHFPRLPNPTIIMYIYPHFSIEGTPVPGYSTTFQMYESVEYALPGEILQK